ncbi:hypothetical protein [Flavobacterium croceum]|uniref:hypothetical protein n=1 Tax=Flavobacterium croceum TaxID=370975 RepID=UPI0024A897DA|nr:hypothetical protein [Flavobacterium croceum]
MNNFKITLAPNEEICLELICLNCREKFSTELDLNFVNENLPYSNNDTLYCVECEKKYDYNIKFDFNVLEISIKGKKINGCLKKSNKIDSEKDSTSTTLKSKKFYDTQIERLQKILDIKSDEYIIEQSLNRLLYSAVITSLETYLNEVFVLIVFHSNTTLEKFVSEYEPYKKEKLNLNEIFEKAKKINEQVEEDLNNFIYHNIPKLIRIFNIFNFELQNFNKLDEVSKHINMRHKLVHRSGLNNENHFEEILKEDVRLVIKNVNSFVDYINTKIENKCFSHEDYFEFSDLPF